MNDEPNDIAALHASLTPENWRALTDWWRQSQHRGRWYTQPPIKGRPPRNSFTLPDDVVDTLGPDPHTAGMVLAGMFHLAPLADGDDPRVIDPDVVANIGHGSLAAGRKVLERFVQMVRRQSREGVTLEHVGSQHADDHGWRVARR
jgi:hypothetical protein